MNISSFATRCAGALALALAANLSAQVALLGPNSGFLVLGGNQQIQWEVSSPANTLNWDLYYSTTGPNGPWLPIVLDLPVTSSSTSHAYTWAVPAGTSLSNRARIRVVQDTAGTDFEAVSASDLRIVLPSATNMTYGSACGLATLNPVYNWMPVTGGVMHTQVTRLQPSTVAVFMILSVFELPTPQDMAPFGMPGCELYMSVEYATSVSFQGSLASYFLSIPNNPDLIGTQLLQQALVVDSNVANPAGAVLSNPMRGLIYNQ